jgi:Ni/Fe-hydrogenase subunit HybB-like protein
MVVGLTVSGIILSTLHQGALGALFTYAPGKLHPLWYSSTFMWFHFFCSAIFGGLSMLIVVSAICKNMMAWRCDDDFMNNIDSLTISLAKGAAMALITYMIIKIIGVAHDNDWVYLLSGWGQWFLIELLVAVVVPLILFTVAIKTNNASLARVAAFIAVLGIALNRFNTALIAFNWQLYQEIPHPREIGIVITVYTLYIITYRFILARLPLLYSWKDE